MTEIYLIRHGEAEGNVFRRLHGQYDSLLMPRGYRQRDCLQERFSGIAVDGCFSSDLTRACLTAQSICVPKGLPLHRDARFRELNVGVWEDMAYGYLHTFYPRDMHAFSHDPKNWQVCGSERYSDYTERFVDGMKAAAEQYPGGTVAIFCHGAVLRGTLMHLFFHDSAQGLPISDNTGVCRIFYDQGSFSYEYLNDNSHIPAELSTYYIQSWWRDTDNRKEADLYFLPYAGESIGAALPPWEEGGRRMTAWLYSGPVGVVSLGRQEEDCGRIIGMSLREDMLGRGYADQLLGCAVSHFRRLGCRRLQLLPGQYPEDIASRYAFDSRTLTHSIDPKAAL